MKIRDSILISIIDDTEPQSPEAVDYENAAEILDRDGWCQGHFSEYNVGTGGVSYCMGGAVAKAIQERLQTGRIPLLNWLAIHLDTGIDAGDLNVGASIPAWNDAPGRTKEEVQDRLMFAAKKLRNEGR